MTPAVYLVHVLQVSGEGRPAALQAALNAELSDVGLHLRSVVRVTDEVPVGTQPAVAVFFGDEAADMAAGVARAESASRLGMAIFPVVDRLDRATYALPGALSHLNAFEWLGSDPARKLARLLLEDLGIEEAQRRVFISHKREDGLAAAEQLHDHLSHAGFQPFIDRFAIRKAADVQHEIADALEDHAFLLVLETPRAHESEWVFDEVEYAMSHTMGLSIVRWPSDPEIVPGSAGLERVRLAEEELEMSDQGAVLTKKALDRVIDEVEAAHARGLVRRRNMLVRSIQEAAAAAGARATALPGWRVQVERDRHPPELLGVTPRLPTPTDLQELDIARARIGEKGSEHRAVLVHSTRLLREKRASHLQWVTADRQLELLAENAIGGRWSREP